MATDDSKTQSSTNNNKNNKEDALSSFELCDKIYNQLESIVKGKTKMDYKNETQVSNTFESLYWQMGLLKGKISEEESKAARSQLQLNSVPSAQTQLIRSETKNLPRELMKEGFVEKRGEGPLKGWKKRYLQLYTNKTIDYYVDSTLKELKGTIYLSKSNIKDTKFENALEINYNINFGFNIHTIKRVWEFRVHSTTDRAKWIDAINDCIEQKGLTYGKGRRQTETPGNGSNSNRLNSPQSKINFGSTRGQSSSLSFLGGGNNEYLQSVENQLQKAQTTRVEHVNLDNHKTKDLALPKRKFLDLDHNFSGSDEDLLNTDSGNNSGNNSDDNNNSNNNNNNGKKQISQMDSIDI